MKRFKARTTFLKLAVLQNTLELETPMACFLTFLAYDYCISATGAVVPVKCIIIVPPVLVMRNQHEADGSDLPIVQLIYPYGSVPSTPPISHDTYEFDFQLLQRRNFTLLFFAVKLISDIFRASMYCRRR